MDLPPELVQALGANSPIMLIALWVGINLREMTKSVNSLNEKIATILERTDGHSRRLDEHSDRISKLEVH